MADLKPQDVIEVLTQDHREVEEMFVKLEAMQPATTPTQRKRRKDLVDQVTIELIRHAVAEEAEVYPAVQDKLTKKEAERARKEHAEAEETMKRLEKMDAGDPGFDDAVAELIREIRHHAAEEESRMFTELRANFSREELVDMAEQVEAIKKIAPTRAHPMTPNDAGVRLAVGPVASLLDHLRDAVSGRGKTTD